MVSGESFMQRITAHSSFTAILLLLYIGKDIQNMCGLKSVLVWIHTHTYTQFKMIIEYFINFNIRWILKKKHLSCRQLCSTFISTSFTLKMRQEMNPWNQGCVNSLYFAIAYVQTETNDRILLASTVLVSKTQLHSLNLVWTQWKMDYSSHCITSCVET